MHGTIGRGGSNTACIFKIDETLKAIAAHASANNLPILFVHDDGVYLMVRGLADEKRTAEGGRFRALVSYALGCNPQADSEFYDTARALVGGDDFAEEFSGHEAQLIIRACAEGYSEVRIQCSETHLNLTIEP